MNRSRRILTALGFAVALAATVPACVFQASGKARVRTSGTVVVRQPPEPRHERVETKSGYVWVRGHWEWRGNDYVWVDGHWERARSGKAWRDGYWEQRGNGWVWVDGEWVVHSGSGTVIVREDDGGRDRVRDHRDGGSTTVVVDDGRPRRAPPAHQHENPGNKKGYVWIRGHWEWRNGDWEWIPGHWERSKSKQYWVDGYWELRGDVYVWVDGYWDKEANRPNVRDHRDGGGGTTVVVKDDGRPRRAPPSHKDEKPGNKKGYVWIRGHWDWRNGDWEWIPGHWERAKSKQYWVDGYWELRGDVYVWVEGRWDKEENRPNVRDHRGN
jgi:hypothetical protein